MLLTLLHKIKFGEVVFVLFGEVCSIIQRRVSVSHKETLKRKGVYGKVKTDCIIMLAKMNTLRITREANERLRLRIDERTNELF